MLPGPISESGPTFDAFRKLSGSPTDGWAGAEIEALVLECRADYARGTCPFTPDLVLVNWDTQMAHYTAIVTAWLVDGTGCVIDQEGNKLTILFEDVGEKRVLDSFVTPVG